LLTVFVSVSESVCSYGEIKTHLANSAWDEAEVLLNACEFNPVTYSLKEKLYQGRGDSELDLLNQVLAWKHNIPGHSVKPVLSLDSRFSNPWVRLLLEISLPVLLLLCLIFVLRSRLQKASIFGLLFLILLGLQYRANQLIDSMVIVRSGTGLRASPDPQSPVLYEFFEPRVSQMMVHQNGWAQIRSRFSDSEEITGYVPATALLQIP